MRTLSAWLNKNAGAWLNKRAASIAYAIEGLAFLFKTQANVKIHVTAIFIVLLLGVMTDLSGMEWCVIVIAIILVLSVEAVNTSIEVLADKVSPEQHPLIKHCKDTAAAAVLITAVGAIILAIIVFLPHWLAH